MGFQIPRVFLLNGPKNVQKRAFQGKWTQLKLSKTNMVHLKMNPGSLEIPNSYSKTIIFSFKLLVFPGGKHPFTTFRSQKRNIFFDPA